MDKVTRQCPQTTTFLRRKESRSGIEPRSFRLPALRLTARPNRLTPFCWIRLAFKSFAVCSVSQWTHRHKELYLSQKLLWCSSSVSLCTCVCFLLLKKSINKGINWAKQYLRPTADLTHTLYTGRNTPMWKLWVQTTHDVRDRVVQSDVLRGLNKNEITRKGVNSLALEICNTTKTRVAYGNSHLACV